jgi:hypothetical protein
MVATHKGECFCGTVHVEVSGKPEAMGYCHCQSCRSWSAGPVNAFTLWKPEAVRVTAGAEHLATFQKTERSQRGGWWTCTQQRYRRWSLSRVSMSTTRKQFCLCGMDCPS